MRADLKNIVAAPHFQGIQKEMWVVKYLYSIVVLFIARLSGPRVGPTRREALAEPLPV